jgi:hypothetical protein
MGARAELLKASHNNSVTDTWGRMMDATAESTYRAIGRFIYEFSQLEYSIRFWVAELTGIPPGRFDLIMTHDFALLLTIAMKVFEGSEHEAILKSCRQLNDERVRIVHGLWVPHKQGGTLYHVPRSSLKSGEMNERAQALELLADRALDLRQRFEKGLSSGRYDESY